MVIRLKGEQLDPLEGMQPFHIDIEIDEYRCP